MGIRSDVGLAISRELFNQITEEQRKEWFSDCEEMVFREDAVLLVWSNVKWYPSYAEIASLTTWLRDKDEKSFLLLVATPEYPDDDSECMGEWHDNPFSLYKWRSAGIEYERG